MMSKVIVHCELFSYQFVRKTKQTITLNNTNKLSSCKWKLYLSTRDDKMDLMVRFGDCLDCVLSYPDGVARCS